MQNCLFLVNVKILFCGVFRGMQGFFDRYIAEIQSFSQNTWQIPPICVPWMGSRQINLNRMEIPLVSLLGLRKCEERNQKNLDGEILTPNDAFTPITKLSRIVIATPSFRIPNHPVYYDLFSSDSRQPFSDEGSRSRSTRRFLGHRAALPYSR